MTHSLTLLLLAATAVAAPPKPGGGATRGPVVPTLECAITPAPPPGNGFQTTDVTATLKSGTLASNTQVELRLGIHASGSLLTTVCSSDFGRSNTAKATNVVMSPPITDPDFIWQCNARATSTPCDPAPSTPR